MPAKQALLLVGMLPVLIIGPRVQALDDDLRARVEHEHLIEQREIGILVGREADRDRRLVSRQEVLQGIDVADPAVGFIPFIGLAWFPPSFLAGFAMLPMADAIHIKRWDASRREFPCDARLPCS